MIPYLLISSLSLALFLGCYYLFFRKDKRFLFNRFYLLASLAFSLIVPLLPLPQLFEATYFDDSHLQFSTQKIEISTDLPANSLPVANQTGIRPIFLLYFIYGAVVVSMAFRYVKHLWSMYRLLTNAELGTHSKVPLHLTEEPVAPFSFGHYVVVNKQEYLEGKIHEDIIRHEYLHVRHGHTLDILLVEFLLIFYWFHPLVWAYRQALIVNHEFCADDFAVRGTDNIAAYSHSLLDYMQHRAHPYLGSGFRYSLTKHRILMMQRSASSTFAFASKILLTAIAAISFLALLSFASLPATPPPDDSVFTVVIDAGHGGSDAGVISANEEHQEKALVLAIAQAIGKLNDNPSIRFVFTREADQPLSLKDRVTVATQSQADLFLSLHINQHNDQSQRGVEVYYSEQNPRSDLAKEYSQQFSQHISLDNSRNTTVKTADYLVLRETACPSLLLNLGFLSNSQDAVFLASEENQSRLASQIVQAIAKIQKE